MDQYGQRLSGISGETDYDGISPFLTNIVYATAEMHGLTGKKYREMILQQLEETDWAEFVKGGGKYEHEVYFDPARTRHLWNIHIPKQHKEVDEFLEQTALDLMHGIAKYNVRTV